MNAIFHDTAILRVPGLVEGARLLAAAGIGVLVVAVQRWARRDQPLGPSMEQTCVLLCLAGALVMLTVGESLPRAFGIAGAAAIVRFRTPVEDTRDTTTLFLLMALGMAAGLGMVTVATLGTMVVCACLALSRERRADRPAAGPRLMKVALVAEGGQFPDAHVSSVFAAHRVAVEPLERSHGDRATARYRAVLDRTTSIDEVSAELLNGGTAGITSVSWEASKKRA